MYPFFVSFQMMTSRRLIIALITRVAETVMDVPNVSTDRSPEGGGVLTLLAGEPAVLLLPDGHRLPPPQVHPLLLLPGVYFNKSRRSG